jgi:hypothetical protein
MNGALNNVGVPKAEGGTPKTYGLSNRKRHNQTDLNLPDVPRSGRWGEWVYYLRSNQQCRRRYVVPQDPRTPNQLRCRAALTAASKAWSHSPALTPADRQAWIASGAKVQSRVRLNQSGPLTGQQHFVGRTCAKPRPSPEMLISPRAKRQPQPLPILHSAFILHTSSFILPLPVPSLAQLRHSPHVDRLCPTQSRLGRIRASRPACLTSRPKLRYSGHRRERWRGG